MIGVSPAYFVSRYGNRFTTADIVGGLDELGRIGFHGFQLEIYHPEALADWSRQAALRVRERSAALGLNAHQFVAHFMLKDFADRQHLISDAAIEQMKVVLDIVDRFEECRVVTVPLPAFDAPRTPGLEEWLRLFDRCAEKVGRLLVMVEEAGRRMALEVLPGAVVGGIDGFLRLCAHIGSDTLGFNFDTGHAWACKESLYLIPAKLGGRILGTHLCDNFGHENLSLRPGAGSIDWPRLVGALKACGYAGPWDIEIVCPPQSVAEEYRAGRNFIEALVR
jgi:sugar phosphate isomerase/epimerase